MKRILLPTDFSEAAHKAVRFAIEFFGHQETHYTLFHVHDFSSLEEAPLAECEEKLKNEVDQFSKSSHDAILTIETATGSGNIVKGILDYSEKNDMDMIVMGTQGSSRPRWMGSNTEAVLLHSKCPVFTVPENCEFSIPERIVVPLDPDHPPANNSVKTALSALGSFRPKLFFLSVVDSQDHPGLEDRYSEILSDGYAHEYHIVEHGDVAESILEFSDLIGPDMVILFPRKRQLFKHLLQRSISKRIAHISSVPLLSVLTEDNQD